MRLVCLFLLIVAAHADPQDAHEILREAIRRQGNLQRKDVADITLQIRHGHLQDKGSTHTMARTYWYRAQDRAFRIKTSSNADKKVGSERGVLGKDRYWERGRDGRPVTLATHNREDRKAIETIKSDRAEFERILKMVFLSRLAQDDTVVVWAKSPETRLLKDQPFNASKILGRKRDREKRAYHVLDVARKNEARLRLFLRTDDLTVRKVIQFDRKNAERPVYYYYFGDYAMHETLKLNLPRYFTVHDREPLTIDLKEKGFLARGQLALVINTGLTDADLR